MSDGTISERLAGIEARVAAACKRAGRSREDVQLIAVSKTHPPEAVCEAARAGQLIFGENKVQEARAKIPECPGILSWHLVGHLQRNKVAAAVELFDLIHSVDSMRLIDAIARAADENGKAQRVLLEVNVSGEGTKFGLKPEEVLDVVREADDRYSRVIVMGLMTMPPAFEELEKVRPYFRHLRELRDRCEKETGLELPQLSMGMSHDFEIGIEEGAHWVRVGTAIFGPRPKKEAVNEDL